MGWLAGLAAVLGAGAAITSTVQQGAAQKEAKNAQNDALFSQKQEKTRLEALAAAAPEKERQASLDKRRKRVQTLLTSQQDTGMDAVGTKTLLGG